MVVEGGSRCGVSLWGGCPGRDFLRIGTLVVRMTGSSLLVVGEGEGGGGLLVAPVEERAVPAVCGTECLERMGERNGRVLGGGGVAVGLRVKGWRLGRWWRRPGGGGPKVRTSSAKKSVVLGGNCARGLTRYLPGWLGGPGRN